MANAKKGVVPPQLRPYLFKRGGGRAQSPAGRRSRPHRAARAAPKKATGGIGRVKQALAKVGGVKAVYIAYRVGNETSIVQRVKNVYNTPTMDQALGQLQDAGKDLQARGGAIALEGGIIIGTKWALSKLGISVPDWV